MRETFFYALVLTGCCLFVFVMGTGVGMVNDSTANLGAFLGSIAQ